MTGLIFDVDNKGHKILSLQEIQDNPLLKDLLYWLYPTYSYFETKAPRYRLVVPFSQELPKAEWAETFDNAWSYFFNDHEGIDRTSRNPSQIYYTPYSTPGSEATLYGNFEGALLEPRSIPKKAIPISLPKAPPERPRRATGRAAELEEALEFISPNVPYETWIKIGMALHYDLGGQGFSLWNRWSSTGVTYPGVEELRGHWKSFGNSQGASVTGSTLFKLAQEGGYQASRGPAPRANAPQVSFSATEEEPEEAPDLLLDMKLNFEGFETRDKFDLPSPFLREVFRYILNRGIYSVPLYALGGTIALCGFLSRHRVQTETRLSTNFMVLIIGGTGTGKTLTLGAISSLLEQVGADNYIASRLGSYQGCIEHLHKNGGCMFLIQDEATYEIRSTRSGAVSNAEMRTEEYRMKTFSRHALGADTTKGNKIPTIQRPFYSEVSVATEDMLDSYKINDIKKGLIPRYLMFIGQEESYPKNTQLSYEKRPELLNNLASIKNYTSDLHLSIAKFSPEARQHLDAFEKRMEEHLREAVRLKNHYEGIFARALEHATKLSLLSVVYLSSGYTVTLEGAQWATSVVCHCIRTLLIAVADKLAENQVEENHKRILRMIRENSKGEWIWKRNIFQRARFLTTRTLDDVINRLKEEGLIEIKEGRNRGSLLLRNT